MKRHKAEFFGAIRDRIVWADEKTLFWATPGPEDFRRFPDGGNIIAIESGYSHGFVILECMKVKVTPSGDMYTYQFDVVSKSPQLRSPEDESFRNKAANAALTGFCSKSLDINSNITDRVEAAYMYADEMLIVSKQKGDKI